MAERLKYGSYYHIYNRGNNRENIFIEERNYAYFLRLYAEHIVPVADTYAYCLLRNHFHLLVRIKTVDEQEAWHRDQYQTGSRKRSHQSRRPVFSRKDPSQQFSNLFNVYTKAINKAYQRTGALFERPFGRIGVTSEDYFAQLVIYIHQNPQKHGFVDDFRRWPFSSYHTLLSKKPTDLHRDEVLAWFGGMENVEAAHQKEIADTIITPWMLDDFM